MNVDPLRKWLKLPPGPWPPDHYTLLGLEPGEGDANAIEQRVFERMDLLRRYQLAHPELVTEGMNRLAQAQICLVDPHTRQPYDVALLGHTAELPPTVKVVPPAIKKTPLPPVVTEPPPAVIVEPPPVSVELPPGAKVITYSPELIDSMPEGEPLILSLDEDEPLVDEVPEYVIAEPSLPDESPSQLRLISIAESQRYRRDIYRRLAKLRYVLHSWDRLKPYLADPTHPLSRRADTVVVTTWLGHLRTSLEELHNWTISPIAHESLVATMARQPLAVQMIREMLTGQRQALADDWHQGRKAILQARTALRDEVESLCQKPWSHRIGRPILRQLQKRPEYILVAIGGYALFVAYLRSRVVP